MPHVAVILSGCGVFDGSEIHEAVSVLIHLSRAGATYDCFAPNVEQMHVVNHLTHQPSAGEKRNVLVESARIARGRIQSLEKLDAAKYDAATPEELATEADRIRDALRDLGAPGVSD